MQIVFEFLASLIFDMTGVFFRWSFQAFTSLVTGKKIKTFQEVMDGGTDRERSNMLRNYFLNFFLGLGFICFLFTVIVVVIDFTH